MNPLLILSVLAVASVVLKPGALKNSADNPAHSPLVNKLTVASSFSNPKVIKTPVAVLGISDKANWDEDREVGKGKNSVVSQKATEMLIAALLRSGQCEIVNQGDCRYLSNREGGTKEEQLIDSDPCLKGDGPSTAKYVIQGLITDYGYEVITIEFDSDSGEKGDRIKYARARLAIDLRITDARTGEVIKALSLRDELRDVWVEGG